MGRLPAGFGARAAGFGAFLAMVGFVFGALGAAVIADFGAKSADVRGKFGTSGHLAGGERAKVGATTIKLDAAGHHVDIGFAKAGGGAAFTGFAASVAGLDAVVERVVMHGRKRKAGLRGPGAGPFRSGRAGGGAGTDGMFSR